MTIPTINEIVDGIAIALDPIEARVTAGMTNDVNPPAILIVPKYPWDIAVTFDGGIDMDVSLHCYASIGIADGSQRIVNDWLSVGTPESIHDLIAADPTLGGLVGSAVATSVDAYGLDAEPSSARYVVATMTVNVKK